MNGAANLTTASSRKGGREQGSLTVFMGVFEESKLHRGRLNPLGISGESFLKGIKSCSGDQEGVSFVA